MAAASKKVFGIQQKLDPQGFTQLPGRATEKVLMFTVCTAQGRGLVCFANIMSFLLQNYETLFPQEGDFQFRRNSNMTSI